MWIKSLEIDGFGCLADRSIEFGPGLTVVTGLNESGKSTLHAAILAAIFGFFDGPDRRRQHAQEQLRQRFEPWEGGAYGLTAVVERDLGTALRLVWDYHGRTHLRAYDALTGGDVSAEHRGAFEGALNSLALWGVSREFYTRACFVRQGELGALDDERGAITRTIEAIASSGRGDESAQRALELLDRSLAEDIGSDRARVRPLPRARLRVEELEAELAAVEARRREFSDLADAAQAAAERADELERAEGAARMALDGARLAALDRKLQDAAQLKAHVDELEVRIEHLRSEAGAALVDEAEVRALDSGRVRLLREIETVSKEGAEAQDTVDDVLRRTRACEHEVELLAPYASGPDAAALAELTAAVGRLEALDGDPDPIETPEPPDNLLNLEERVAKEAHEREELRGRRDASGTERARGWLVAAGIAIVGGVGAFALGALPVAVVMLLLAVGAILLWVRSARATVDPASESRLTELDARVIQAADQRATYERAIAVAEGQRAERERRLKTSMEARAQDEASINRLLTAAGVDVEDRPAAVRAFQRAAERRTTHAEKIAELERLRHELNEAQRPGQERGRLELELHDVSRRLGELYEASSISEPDLADARRQFDDRLEAHRRLQAADTEKRREAAGLSGLLSGKTPEQLEQERAVIAARGVEPRPDLTETEEELSDRARELAERSRRAVQEARELKGQLQQALRDLPAPAGLREELHRERERVSALEAARTVLEIVHATLEEAAEESYRDIAPRLNEALGRTLDRITHGRYNEAFVDADYQVRVRAQGTRELVEADLLSHGTRDQIYLVERLELVEILTGDESLPVLLDDPLSHCDPRRRATVAEFLSDCSERRQLIVLSTDPTVADVLSGACARCSVVDLDENEHRPSTHLAARPK